MIKLIPKKQKGGYVIDNFMPEITKRYVSLLNQGISPQAAFDTSHLSIIEDGRPGKYYSFGKRATNLNDWTNNVVKSLTTGRYKVLNDSTNFDQFKQLLKSKNYNVFQQFYRDLRKGRNKNKERVNLWNQQNGLPLVSMNNYGDQNKYT